VQVKANLGPKPAGGRGPLSRGWYFPHHCPAQLVALAALDTDTVWLFTLEEARGLAQQHSDRGTVSFTGALNPRCPGRLRRDMRVRWTPTSWSTELFSCSPGEPAARRLSFTTSRLRGGGHGSARFAIHRDAQCSSAANAQLAPKECAQIRRSWTREVDDGSERRLHLRIGHQTPGATVAAPPSLSLMTLTAGSQPSGASRRSVRSSLAVVDCMTDEVASDGSH
jgi:hypothetical protein